MSLIEPRVQYITERKAAKRKDGPYYPRTDEEAEAALLRLFSARGFKNMQISGLKRMTGGASKEQFAFWLAHDQAPEPKRYILRMDPLEGINETCRLREAQILRAVADVVPVRPVFDVDPEGEYLGQPGLLIEFVPGVTKPTDPSITGVSGIGSNYGRYTELLAPQFVENLARIHSWTDWHNKDLSTYVIPRANTNEAALYQLNDWALTWAQDKVEPVPMVTLVENWLRENAPVCEAPCLVHCDYRLGNFMFEEPSGKITTILDWELAHFGDFHEDIAWILQKLFGGWNDKGEFLVCNLMPRDKFLDDYQRLSGRTINPETLRYYEVMNAWKCAIMDLGSAIMAGQNSNSHQDVLITWLGSAGAVFLDQMVELIRGQKHAT